MDPISAIGIASSILGISDIIARSLKGLLGLQSSYKAANLLITIIIGYLTTVKAALNEIGDWISSAADALTREQLVLDIKRAVESCEIIISAVDHRVSALKRDSAHGLTAKARVAFALEEQSIKTFSEHLGNQVHALNLLVTAAQCRTNQDRYAVLRDTETREAIRQIEDDSSSYIQGDSSSSVLTQRSAATNDSAFLDQDFVFDHLVLNSNVYRQALRSMLHKSKQRPVDTELQPVTSQPLVPEFHLVVDEPAEAASVRSSDTVVPLAAHARDQNEGGDEPNSNHDPTNIKQLHADTQRSRSYEELLSNLPLPDLGSTTSPLSGMKLRSKKRGRGLSSLFPILNGSTPSIYEIIAAERDKESSKFTTPKEPSVKNLMLESSDSGKPTVLEDLLLYSEGTYTLERRNSFKGLIFSSVVQSMRTILEAMEFFDLPFDNERQEYHVQSVFLQPEMIEGDVLPEDAGAAIMNLRADSGVREAIARSKEYQLADCAQYYFDNISRIMSSSYVPTDEDILWYRGMRSGSDTPEVVHPSNNTCPCSICLQY